MDDKNDNSINGTAGGVSQNIPSWFESQEAVPLEKTTGTTGTGIGKGRRLVKWLPWFLVVCALAYSAFATTQWLHYQSNYDDYVMKAGKDLSAAEDDGAPLVDKRNITASGLLEELDNKAEMILYVCQLDQSSCDQSAGIINDQTGASKTAKDIFYTFDTSLGGLDASGRDDIAKALTRLGDVSQPALVYIRGGEVIEKVTDITSASAAAFLSKY